MSPSYSSILIIALACLSAPVHVQAALGDVDTLAAGTPFYKPRGVAFNQASAIVYVADTAANTIRWTREGSGIYTIAGQFDGSTGDADGAGGQASFSRPIAVAFDPSSDTLYVADANNNAVRTVARATGAVATLAGGSSGFADGVGTNASFKSPRGVTFDPADDTLYVADFMNHAVRSVASDGTVTTFAGGSQGSADGVGVLASLNGPNGVAFDGVDTIAVADTFNSVIRIIAVSTATVTTLAGTPGSAGFVNSADGEAAFWMPYAVAFGVAFTPSSDPDSGTLYVADTNNHAVRTVASDGAVATLAGTGSQGFVNGAGDQATFKYPNELAFDPSSGALYVADERNHAIRTIEAAVPLSCAEDEYVSNRACETCAPGTTNDAGDAASGANTECAATLCAADEHVFENACETCAPGTTNAADDDASGENTECATIEDTAEDTAEDSSYGSSDGDGVVIDGKDRTTSVFAAAVVLAAAAAFA